MCCWPKRGTNSTSLTRGDTIASSETLFITLFRPLLTIQRTGNAVSVQRLKSSASYLSPAILCDQKLRKLTCNTNQ
jgi:hypothetical protein